MSPLDGNRIFSTRVAKVSCVDHGFEQEVLILALELHIGLLSNCFDVVLYAEMLTHVGAQNILYYELASLALSGFVHLIKDAAAIFGVFEHEEQTGRVMVFQHTDIVVQDRDLAPTLDFKHVCVSRVVNIVRGSGENRN